MLHLGSALYLRNDPYETSDAVFGVKDSLVIDLGDVTPELAKKYDVSEKSKLLTYDFVLVGDKAASDLRVQKAKDALTQLGLKMKFDANLLPIPDVD